MMSQLSLSRGLMCNFSLFPSCKNRQQHQIMGRRVCPGSGQSSLGYLFGGGEAPKNPPTPKVSNNEPSVDNNKKAPAGILSNTTTNTFTNNYLRADGQNCGNFLSVRH